MCRPRNSVACSRTSSDDAARWEAADGAGGASVDDIDGFLSLTPGRQQKTRNPVVLEPERFAAGVGPRVAPSVDAAVGDAALQQVWCQSVCLSVQPSAVLRLSPDPQSLSRYVGTGNAPSAIRAVEQLAEPGPHLYSGSQVILARLFTEPSKPGAEATGTAPRIGTRRSPPPRLIPSLPLGASWRSDTAAGTPQDRA